MVIINLQASSCSHSLSGFLKLSSSTAHWLSYDEAYNMLIKAPCASENKMSITLFIDFIWRTFFFTGNCRKFQCMFSYFVTGSRCWIQLSSTVMRHLVTFGSSFFFFFFFFATRDKFQYSGLFVLESGMRNPASSDSTFSTSHAKSYE